MSDLLPPQGWYDDPSDPTACRWWDGQAWTAHTRPLAARPRPLLSDLPWQVWAPWLVAIGVAAFVCFGFGESTRVAQPDRWFAAGFCIVAALTVGCAAATSPTWRFSRVAALGLVASAVVSLALFSMSAPSTSRSCANNGQPHSAGTFDCDTSYGLGGPVMLVAFWIPGFVLAAAGTGGRRLMARRHER